jgi:hypothetical protein
VRTRGRLRVSWRSGRPGYSDIEVALLAEAGLLSEQAVIVTTVRELRVLGEELPDTSTTSAKTRS